MIFGGRKIFKTTNSGIDTISKSLSKFVLADSSLK